MTFDVATDLSNLSDALKLLSEEIRIKMHSVRDEYPERDQKKYNFRELQHQVIVLGRKYEDAYGGFIQEREIDKYIDRAQVMREGIEKVRSRLEIQAA